MKEGLTEVVLVVDRSGSMAGLENDTVGGLNRLLADQRKEEGECRVTFVRFDNQYELVFESKNLDEISDFTTEDISPRGSTALLDAQGLTINAVGARLAAMSDDQRPEKVIFATLTDGYENASREFTNEKVKELIERQKKEYSWHFMFLGANQDAIATARNIGICANASMTYAATGSGCAVTYDAISRNVSDLRSGKLQTASFTASERKAAIS